MLHSEGRYQKQDFRKKSPRKRVADSTSYSFHQRRSGWFDISYLEGEQGVIILLRKETIK
jgi:hypothetical protein